MKSLGILLAALCFAELVHNTIEIWGMSQKVSWLMSIRRGERIRPWPVNINSFFRTIILHSAILIVAGGGAFVMLGLLPWSANGYLALGIALLLLNYAYTTWKVDKFHARIGKVISEEKARLPSKN